MAVVRVALFAAIRTGTPPPVVTAFDGEPMAQGRQRRLANWTPVDRARS